MKKRSTSDGAGAGDRYVGSVFLVDSGRLNADAPENATVIWTSSSQVVSVISISELPSLEQGGGGGGGGRFTYVHGSC